MFWKSKSKWNVSCLCHFASGTWQFVVNGAKGKWYKKAYTKEYCSHLKWKTCESVSKCSGWCLILAILWYFSDANLISRYVRHQFSVVILSWNHFSLRKCNKNVRDSYGKSWAKKSKNPVAYPRSMAQFSTSDVASLQVSLCWGGRVQQKQLHSAENILVTHFSIYCIYLSHFSVYLPWL